MAGGRAVAIAGVKGGVGKTTLSLNLAAALVSTSRSVVVVEASIAAPDVADGLHLDVANRPTLDDVFAGEATAFDAIATTAHGYGVLPISDPRAAAVSDVDRLPRIVEVLQRQYDLVLLDTPPAMGYGASQAFDAADETLLVTTPRLSAVHTARRTETTTRQYGSRPSGIVVNRTGPGNHPKPQRIANYVGVKLLGAVPDDDAVAEATDAGEPVITHTPESRAATALRDVGKSLAVSRSR
ncbi:septum site-determining protein MinD [Halogranum gelatinilyticum]|uniref:Septum site-determining protein MinD n=1 Tax=Halogranum gelatinilyticum TaxID=660521 RepID=A0A1G9UFE7_9EURY|nr:septum site-determining protein MinD [Halogranum gelatinilyticum]